LGENGIKGTMSSLVQRPREKYDDSAFDAFSASTAYSFGTARAAAWLSELAYESDADKIDSVLAAWGLTAIAKLNRPSAPLPPLAQTKCLVATGRGATFIAFGGTDPLLLRNWVTDLLAFPNADDIHRGFAIAAEVVWPEVHAAYEKSGADGTAFFAVGHSLGGALAVIAAENLRAEFGRAVSGVYTFGLPRVGKADFARRYDGTLAERTFRLVHGDDIIPCVPLALLGFRHVGRILTCPRFGQFKGLAPSADLSSNEPRLGPTVLRRAIENLEISKYRQRLQDRAARERGLAFDWLPPVMGDHLPDRYLRAVSA
jgi:triacylglycerol lipase